MNRPPLDRWQPGLKWNQLRMRWAKLLQSEAELIRKGVMPCDTCHKYHIQLTSASYRDLLEDRDFHQALKQHHVPNFLHDLIPGEGQRPRIRALEGAGFLFDVGTLTIEVIASNDPGDPVWGRCPLKGKEIKLTKLLDTEV